MAILAAPPPPDFAGSAAVITELPAHLAAARARLGLTQQVAAKQIGVGSDTLARLEARTSTPTQTTILAALRWLDSNGGT